ncbi:MAG: bifunctional isocitrate dehydrogenase kinase/phosphatase [Rhodothermales bacterium]|nr:bifunctional isocitrate dehydrogenase kinase/phosphatase [Rhodothermales bacterium]
MTKKAWFPIIFVCQVRLNQHLSNSRIAVVAARKIFRAYESFNTRFTVITERARARFEARDVDGMRLDSRQRLDLYKGVVDRVEVKVRELLGDRIENEKVWASIKAVFSAYSSEREDWDIAETFFNSVTRRIFSTRGVNEDIEFVATDFATPPNRSSGLVYRHFNVEGELEVVLQRILNSYHFSKTLRNGENISVSIADRIHARLNGSERVAAIDMVKSVFYRDGRAYLIGRAFTESETVPIAIVLQAQSESTSVEAVLLYENELSILFSFTRSYFHVLANCPNQLVRFLESILPAKRVAELYISIGFNKHGKTEMYREVLGQLGRTSELFYLAPGDRGMVMRVFTMPDYDLVFKIIKDRFDPPKTTTPKIVREKYQLVFRHERVGRLVDAQEFENLKFDRHRFDETLLTELQNVASRNISVEGDHVYIHHVYIQRRVQPLNILARSDIDVDRLSRIVLDFGHAIKELARSNIFPGDLFLKNFGVTRHDRVVFYDYDELDEVMELNFRKMPRASTYDEEMQAEPWFAVAEEDVFPEEFLQFLGLPDAVRTAFLDEHADLFSVEFWHEIQTKLSSGTRFDNPPFPAQNMVL